jgi:hypothetical protein
MLGTMQWHDHAQMLKYKGKTALAAAAEASLEDLQQGDY